MNFIMLIADEEYREQLDKIFLDLHCFATMIASTGEFLQYGETVYLVGAKQELTDMLIKRCKAVFSKANEKNEACIRMYIMRTNQFVKIGGGNSDDVKERKQSA